MKQVYRALYAFLTSICFLLVSILFVLITKDDWHLFGTIELICTVSMFAMFPIYGIVCRHFGKIDERQRQRTRITNLMETYQTEPHGIRYSQHRREG